MPEPAGSDKSLPHSAENITETFMAAAVADMTGGRAGASGAAKSGPAVPSARAGARPT